VDILSDLSNIFQSKIRFLLNFRALLVRRIFNEFYSYFHNFCFGNVIQHYLKKTKFQVFSLELHASVTRDLIPFIKQKKSEFTRWSISPSSFLFAERNLKVHGINSRNWTKIDPPSIAIFQDKYKFFLSKIDLFVVSYSFSLIKLYKKYRKPILAINATRYESPYTLNHQEFISLNEDLFDLSSSKLLTVISNNLGDKDYLRILADIESAHIPSLCNYTETHNPVFNKWIISCRNFDLSNRIADDVPNAFTSESLFPQGFSYSDVSRYRGVILIPYNISTMRLFELTTAGFPVRIPSDQLLRQWINLPGVLSELSWLQVHNSETPQWLKNTPADPHWNEFYPWWLERADWNDKFFFPNVSRFNSIEELREDPPPFSYNLIASRNIFIENLWKSKLSELDFNLDN
jgi:hypothetical protein